MVQKRRRGWKAVKPQEIEGASHSTKIRRSIMPETERMFKQQERLEAQRKRINEQKRRKKKQGYFGDRTKRRDEESKMVTKQNKRVIAQKKLERERAGLARIRGEAVTGIDLHEAQKISKQSKWCSKWDRRRARWETRARKYIS
ncbi:MAG: hypothetical protein L6265_11800 [Thermoplasmatales archaeon]|nr:hypothetical protein [Thermoplasmatales archaeon]